MFKELEEKKQLEVKASDKDSDRLRSTVKADGMEEENGLEE